MPSSPTTLTEAEIVSSLMSVASAGAVAVAAAARLLPASRDLTTFMEIAQQTAIRLSSSASAVSTLHSAAIATREPSHLLEQITNMTAIRRVTEQATAEATTPPSTNPILLIEKYFNLVKLISFLIAIVSTEERRVTIKSKSNEMLKMHEICHGIKFKF